MNFDLDNTYEDRRLTQTPPIRELPGFVRHLHRLKRAQDICLVCGADWPCRGAELQIRDASRFTHPHWLDSAHFRAMADELEEDARRDLERRQRRKASPDVAKEPTEDAA
jgi:hypothetical protein